MDLELKRQIESLAASEDQTKVSEFAGNIAPAGKQVGRFVEYIEFGMQPRKAFKGKAKPPAEEIRVVFELLGKKSLREIEFEKDGVTIKKLVSDRIAVQLTKSTSEKANFVKLFKRMTYGRDNIKHMAQMLGEAFVLDVKHRESAGTKKIYANLYSDGVYGIEAPFKVDAETGEKTPYKVPPALSKLKLFSFNNPTADGWSALYLDGVIEVKNEDGSISKRSKNWMQEKIMGAVNFKGSKLESLVRNLSVASYTDDASETLQNIEDDSFNPMDELE